MTDEKSEFIPEQWILSTRLDSLHSDVQEIKSALTQLTAAITKLAIVEERQQRSSEALDRAFNALRNIEIRLSEIEKTLPMLRAESGKSAVWIDRVMWAFISIVLGATASAAFFGGLPQ